MICDNCQHNRVCKHEDNMRKFDAEVSKMLEQKEFKTFGIEMKCDNYFDYKKYSDFKRDMMKVNKE